MKQKPPSTKRISKYHILSVVLLFHLIFYPWFHSIHFRILCQVKSSRWCIDRRALSTFQDMPLKCTHIKSNQKRLPQQTKEYRRINLEFRKKKKDKHTELNIKRKHWQIDENAGDGEVEGPTKRNIVRRFRRRRFRRCWPDRCVTKVARSFWITRISCRKGEKPLHLDIHTHETFSLFHCGWWSFVILSLDFCSSSHHHGSIGDDGASTHFIVVRVATFSVSFVVWMCLIFNMIAFSHDVYTLEWLVKDIKWCYYLVEIS